MFHIWLFFLLTFIFMLRYRMGPFQTYARILRIRHSWGDPLRGYVVMGIFKKMGVAEGQSNMEMKAEVVTSHYIQNHPSSRASWLLLTLMGKGPHSPPTYSSSPSSFYFLAYHWFEKWAVSVPFTPSIWILSSVLLNYSIPSSTTHIPPLLNYLYTYSSLPSVLILMPYYLNSNINQ